MRFTLTSLAAAAALCLPSFASAVIITDTFSRSETMAWGAVDNGPVGGESGSVAASYTLDGGGNVDGSAGRLSNNRIVLNYNLATDANIIAGGGFIAELQVTQPDGDDANGESGTGREFTGIAVVDSNSNPPFGGVGAITNVNNDVIRYGLLPRNSGSVGYLARTAGNTRVLAAGGNPNSGFNEFVYDQPVFDDYVNQGVPDPFVNPKTYNVTLIVQSDFTAAAPSIGRAFIDGVEIDFDLADADIDPLAFEWGDAGQAYLSFLGFNGPHVYDNLKIRALPEPTSALIGLLAIGGLSLRRRS